MTDVVQTEPAAGTLRITRGGVLVFTASSLIGAGLGAALLSKRPVIGAVVGTFVGGLLVPGLIVAALIPLARVRAGS